MHFIDLKAQQDIIRGNIEKRIATVLDHGAYIMGPEVSQLERALTDFCGAKHCISCANGTDALQLALMALDVGVGDAVFVPSFTFAATAEAVCLVGATPFFVDIDPQTFNMDPKSLEGSIKHALELDLQARILIPVDLFGLPADYLQIQSVADAEKLDIVCDSAQGFGGQINGMMTGNFGRITTTSFFPAKPLGCYGDGGALFTNDADLAVRLDSLRVHGKGQEKYDNIHIGMNSRLDTLQAAILLEKLAIYANEIENRQKIAERYTATLHNHFATPYVTDGYRSIWAQYTLRTKDKHERNGVMALLKEKAIPAAIYYPIPLHLQRAYREFPCDPKA